MNVGCRKTNIEYFTGRCSSLDGREWKSPNVWKGLKKRLLSYKLHCNEFWRHLEPTQYTRDEVFLSSELEWMHMEEHLPGSAATDGGGMGIGDTTL